MKNKLFITILISSLTLGLLAGCGIGPIQLPGGTSDDTPTSSSVSEDITVSEEVCDHEWTEATCLNPRTCANCGLTEGTTLEHDWSFATTKAPKTCNICGTEEGGKVVINEIYIKDTFSSFRNYYMMGRDRVLAYTSDYEFGIYDHDGNTIVNLDCYDGMGGSWNVFNRATAPSYFVILNYNPDVIPLKAYDSDGNIVFSASITWDDLYEAEGEDCYDLFYVSFPVSTLLSDKQTVRFYDDTTGKALFYINLDSGTYYKASEFTEPEEETTEYDESKYGYFMKSRYFDYYFAANVDKTEWFFMDLDENVIASYADVSDFSSNGFAIASYDREYYFIIDKDFNVVSDTNIPGSTGVLSPATDLLYVKNNDVITYFDVYYE